MLIGQTIPEKRIIEAVNQEEYKYEVGDLPTEWEGKCLGFCFYFHVTWKVQNAED